MIIGIYAIKNNVTNKIYIGKTTDFEIRKKEHIRKLKAKRHHNRHLQSSFNKNGIDSFVFDIIEKCDLGHLDEKEKYWIEFYKTTNDNNGYNIMSGGQGGKGTKEVIEKQRKSQEKNKKKVYAFNLNGELCLSWDSIKECSKDLLVNPCDIRRTITKQQYSCRGYILQSNSTFEKRDSPSERAKLRERNLDGTFKKFPALEF